MGWPALCAPTFATALLYPPLGCQKRGSFGASFSPKKKILVGNLGKLKSFFFLSKIKIEKWEKNQQINRDKPRCVGSRVPEGGGGRRKERAGRAGRMYSWDGVAIMGVSIAGTLFCELISWILIYRKSSYKSLVASITRWVGEDAERENQTDERRRGLTLQPLSLSLSLHHPLARSPVFPRNAGRERPSRP